MDKQAFNELVERLVAAGYEQDLAGDIAVKIGSTPELNFDGNIEVTIEDNFYLIPWEIYEPE